MLQGEYRAVVGENGSGKSTLVKLLCGIYEAGGGDILINGKSISKYSKKSLYKKITAVFQNFGKYALNITENICLSAEENKEKTDKLIKEANFDKINEIPKDSVLSREFGGVDISGGMWQKIVILRAKYRDSEVYLLDEPTSAIDSNEEKRLYESFKNMTSGKTAFIVTHRMSAARICEKIIVMNKGRICGFGTHEKLQRTCDEYKRLWNSQAV